MFYFYFQDQHEEEFRIQVDVLMNLLVFQDPHYDRVKPIIFQILNQEKIIPILLLR
jgi:hypothetical protein